MHVGGPSVDRSVRDDFEETHLDTAAERVPGSNTAFESLVDALGVEARSHRDEVDPFGDATIPIRETFHL